MSVYLPPEWAPHEAMLTAWPWSEEIWEGADYLKAAQQESEALIQAMLEHDEGVYLLIRKADEKELRARFEHPKLQFYFFDYGDIWLRDTAPTITIEDEMQTAHLFRFNGWGEKHFFEGDQNLGEGLARDLGLAFTKSELTAEGGAFEWDGEGTLITTRDCLLHEKRNPQLNEKQIEEVLRDELGQKKILWINKGLENDHTDGHVDTLARFSKPGELLLMDPTEPDPNFEVLKNIQKELSTTDAKGRELKHLLVPSPGQLVSPLGHLLPPSYLNFIICNKVVIVPIYGSKFDDEAVEKIGKAFPNRKTIGLSAKAIIEGGGAFHCITQQIPKEVQPNVTTH